MPATTPNGEHQQRLPAHQRSHVLVPQLFVQGKFARQRPVVAA
jgi:hypothetical protein